LRGLALLLAIAGCGADHVGGADHPAVEPRHPAVSEVRRPTMSATDVQEVVARIPALRAPRLSAGERRFLERAIPPGLPAVPRNTARIVGTTRSWRHWIAPASLSRPGSSRSAPGFCIYTQPAAVPATMASCDRIAAIASARNVVVLRVGRGADVIGVVPSDVRQIDVVGHGRVIARLRPVEGVYSAFVTSWPRRIVVHRRRDNVMIDVGRVPDQAPA
jgi:hypothetical protein